MQKRINILMERAGVLYRFGHLIYKDTDDIYYHFGARYMQNKNLHDSYHGASVDYPHPEVHQGRRVGDLGMAAPFIPPEQITAPVQLGSTTSRFEDFKRHTGIVDKHDIRLVNPAHVTHPVIGVYLEPARTLMVRRAYTHLPPPNAQILSIQTRRFTPILDVTVVHVSTAVTCGGLLSFDRRFTSKNLKDYYKDKDGWEIAQPPAVQITIETHAGLLQDLPR